MDHNKEVEPEFTEEHRNINEEFAEESLAQPHNLTNSAPLHAGTESQDEEAGRRNANMGIGWTALALSFISLFVWPQILGPAGAVIGAFAWYRGSRTLGIWSIVIGLISLLSYFVLIPLYA